jgi:CDP-glucose 4,6-dehydratase
MLLAALDTNVSIQHGNCSVDGWILMNGAFANVRVLLTGHTGFKGSWLSQWLKRDGAVLTGLSLPPEPERPSLFEAARVADGMISHFGDIRDLERVRQVVNAAQPEIVFHLAAQALVRRSYREPIETFATNVMGTAHVLEAARQCPSVQAIVCVTTDKVYDNREWAWGYRESDPLGGKDPYSASKACAEIVAAAYRQTMFSLAGDIQMATARGGNVIGGGDWSEDRLIPDIIRALQAREPIILRNPKSTRPWQHVLELVRGYVVLGRRLLDGDRSAAGAWNFGPDIESEIDVETIVKAFLAEWGERVPVEVRPSTMPEAQYLRLDISKARFDLDWRPVLNRQDTLGMTARWYRRHADGEDAGALMEEQIAEYEARLRQ